MDYSPGNKIILAITEQDVIDLCVGRTEAGDIDFEWTEDEVRDHMRSFEKGLEWVVMDRIWESLAAVAEDIEASQRQS